VTATQRARDATPSGNAGDPAKAAPANGDAAGGTGGGLGEMLGNAMGGLFGGSGIARRKDTVVEAAVKSAARTMDRQWGGRSFAGCWGRC